MAELSTLGLAIKTAYEGQANAAYLRALRGDRSVYNISFGSGPLTLTSAMINTFGTPSANVTLTMPDGLVIDEVIHLNVSDFGTTHSLTLVDAVAQSIQALAGDVIYGLRWRGTSNNPRWTVEGIWPRASGSATDVVRGNGSIGALPQHQHVLADIANQVTHVTVTGSRTVTSADSGKTLIYTGASSITWTFTGSGLGVGCHGVGRNASTGTGLITISTNRTLKFKGTSPIPVDASFDWEDDGTRLWVTVNA